jgi:hypothetical protein
MLADIADIADRRDIGAELLFNLQIELLNKSRLELGGLGYERQSRNIGQVRDIWRRRSRQSLFKYRWRACNSRATGVLRSWIDSQACFNLNCETGLAVGAEDGRERSVLKIRVGRVVAGEEA